MIDGLACVAQDPKAAQHHDSIMKKMGHNFDGGNTTVRSQCPPVGLGSGSGFTGLSRVCNQVCGEGRLSR